MSKRNNNDFELNLTSDKQIWLRGKVVLLFLIF